MMCPVGIDRFTPEERQELQRALKWALRPQPWRKTEQGTQLRGWFEKKLAGLIAYANTDKSSVSDRALRFVRLHYSEGMPIKYLSQRYHLSERQVIRDMQSVFDAVIDQASASLLIGLARLPFTWREHGCPYCGCDQYWDSQGAYGPDGEWVGTLCGSRYTANGQCLCSPARTKRTLGQV